MRKIFGPKSITHLIYGLLMMLPFLAIGVKCTYVVCNKNAKDSYSSNTIYQQFAITNETQFPIDQVINIKYKTEISGVYTYVVTNYLSYTAQDLGLSQADYDSINQIRFNGATQKIDFRISSSTATSLDWDNSIDFNIIASSKPTTQDIYSFTYISQVILVQDKLDNVFDYSVSQLINESNGFVPKYDFVGLLNGVFSESSNHIYLKLTNWYLNYALLISTIYILFLAMLWFVNLCRNILERSMNIGNGVDD